MYFFKKFFIESTFSTFTKEKKLQHTENHTANMYSVTLSYYYNVTL